MGKTGQKAEMAEKGSEDKIGIIVESVKNDHWHNLEEVCGGAGGRNRRRTKKRRVVVGRAV